MAAKSVAQKLQIKSGATVWLSERAFLERLEPLPEGVRPVSKLEQAATAVLIARDAASLGHLVETHAKQLSVPEILWVAYPKGNRADINRDSVWPALAAHGLRPVSQVAVDDVWSALRFRPLAEGEAPFTGGR